MTPEAIAGLTSGVVGGSAGFFAYLSARKANARAAVLERGRLVLDEQRHTWERYEALVDQLQEEVGRLQDALRNRDDQLEHLRDQVGAMQGHMDAMREENVRLMETITNLKFTLGRLARTHPDDSDAPDHP